MIILGLETSCDETSVAVCQGSEKILSNVTATSLAHHAPYGGIIPEIASRIQLESICAVLEAALKRARVQPKDIDAVGVTEGPGLIGSLLVGISFAKGLSESWGKPLIGINHVRAHLYAAFIHEKISFPFVGLVVSGGHTSLYRVNGISDEKLVGATRDDAAGEAFDKVAKILGLGYPGGPAVEERAKQGDIQAYPLRCDCSQGVDFSFSGIKTAVLYKVQALKKMYGHLSAGMVSDLCASFQEAVIHDIVEKSMRACRRYNAKTLAVGGGVAFNNYLRQRLAEAASRENIRLCVAAKEYCLDNAAMVATLACRLLSKRKNTSVLKMDVLAG